MNACLLFLVLLAPAPLPSRRVEVLPRPLPFCEMIWAGCKYTTHFRPDGSYQAAQSGSLTWYGTWTFKREDGQLILAVKESLENTGKGPWYEWRVLMRDTGMLSGTLGTASGSEVSFGLVSGKVDS